MNGDQLWDIVEGLQTNGLLYYDYLITGTWPCSSGMCTAERTSKACLLAVLCKGIAAELLDLCHTWMLKTRVVMLS